MHPGQGKRESDYGEVAAQEPRHSGCCRYRKISGATREDRWIADEEYFSNDRGIRPNPDGVQAKVRLLMPTLPAFCPAAPSAISCHRRRSGVPSVLASGHAGLS